MVAKKNKDVDLPKLFECMERDYRVLQVYRENLLQHVREFVGSHYSDPTTPNNGVPGERPENPENPVNLISLYVRIMTGHLVGADPRMMVSTFDRTLRRYMNTFEEWGNRRLKQIDFGNVLARATLDALFLMGIVKTSLTAPAEARFGGYGLETGKVSISNVDFEDFVFDTRAKKWEECSYIGHRYRLLLEDVQKSKIYKSKPKLAAVASDDPIFNPGGDERISGISRGGNRFSDSYDDYIEVWEICLPREGIVVTFDADGDHAEPLLVQDWVGPKCGPYQILSFGDVPGQLLPKSPIMDLIDPHRTVNHLTKKLDNQASRAKIVTLYQDVEDAKKIQDAKDGEMVRVTSVNAVQEVVVGAGPSQAVGVHTQLTTERFKADAGNLNALGGLASQADTATQEKLVTESASAMVRSMARQVTKFAQGPLEAMGWFWWRSPYEEMSSTYSAPGAPGISIDRKVSPLDRIGRPFDELEIQIDPYSLSSQTPQMRIQMINELMETVAKFLPLFAQPGVGDFLQAAIRLKAKYANNPDMIDVLEKLVGIEGPPEQQADPQQAGMPEETTRNYVRTSQPGMTDKGNTQVLQQMLAGGQPQQGAMGGGLGQMRAG